jgi:hypothetical protein
MTISHKLHILGYAHAMQFIPIESTLAIRVWDVGTRDYVDARGNYDNGPAAPLQESELWVGQLGFRFGDVDPDTHELHVDKKRADEIREECANSIITPKIAQKLVEAFSQHYKKATALLFHCNAGSSRSPAVAFAMKEIFQLDYDPAPRAKRVMTGILDSKVNKVGNLTVYNSLIAAAKKADLC